MLLFAFSIKMIIVWTPSPPPPHSFLNERRVNFDYFPWRGKSEKLKKAVKV